MIRQCAILFGCLALGELIVFLTGIKLPSSIIGMLLLTLFLKSLSARKQTNSALFFRKELKNVL